MEINNRNGWDLYVLLAPNYDTLKAVRSNDGIGGFREFIQQQVNSAAKSPLIPDQWMFHYVLPQEAGRVTERPDSNYFRNMVDELVRWDHFPFGVVRLRDAVYCREKQIPLLTPQAQHTALSMQEDYRQTMESYGETSELHAVLPPFRTCTAVQVANGVLLFSSGPKGVSQLREFRRWLLHHYFDPQLELNELKEYRLPLFNPYLEPFIDRFPGTDYKGVEKTRIDDVFVTPPMAPQHWIRDGLLTERYDLSPTLTAFERLFEKCRKEDWMLSVKGVSRDIAGLLDIRQKGLEPFFTGPSLGTFGYSDSFSSLYKKLSNATDASEAEALQQEARILAESLLEQHFPIRRGAELQEEQTARTDVCHVASIRPAKQETGQKM